MAAVNTPDTYTAMEATQTAAPVTTAAPLAAAASSGAPAPAPAPASPDNVAGATSASALAGAAQGPTAYNPTSDALVSSQLEKLLAKDSPYLDMARTRASQVAAKRGLLNSSIAAGSGEAAAIQSALPIAQADANTYDQAGRLNTQTANQFTADSNQFGRQSALAQYQGILGEAARVGSQNYTTGRDAQQFQNQLATINAQTDAAIRLYDAQNGTKLYDSYREQSQQTYDSYLTAMQAIQTSDMDATVKAAQITQLQQSFTTRQQFINTMYAEAPRWNSAWSQFVMNFGTPTTATNGG